MKGFIFMPTLRDATMETIRNLNDSDFNKVTDFVRTLTHSRSQSQGASDAEVDQFFQHIATDYSTDMERLAQ